MGLIPAGLISLPFPHTCKEIASQRGQWLHQRSDNVCDRAVPLFAVRSPSSTPWHPTRIPYRLQAGWQPQANAHIVRAMNSSSSPWSVSEHTVPTWPSVGTSFWTWPFPWWWEKTANAPCAFPTRTLRLVSEVVSGILRGKSLKEHQSWKKTWGVTQPSFSLHQWVSQGRWLEGHRSSPQAGGPVAEGSQDPSAFHLHLYFGQMLFLGLLDLFEKLGFFRCFLRRKKKTGEKKR